VRVRRRSDDDPFEDYYDWDGIPHIGEAHGLALPFWLTDAEAAKVMKDLKAQEKRRITPGFQLPGHAKNL
jgi:hypothetical protein